MVGAPDHPVGEVAVLLHREQRLDPAWLRAVWLQKQ